jgi:hypothetical protein
LRKNIFRNALNYWSNSSSKPTGRVQATRGKVSAMNVYRRFVLLGLLSAFSFSVPDSLVLAATPEFTVTATDVTMSSSNSSGTGSSSFTLTSVNNYTGTVQVLCEPPTPPAGTKIPYCGSVAVRTYSLTANQKVTGNIGFYNAPVPCSNPCPVSQPRRGHGLAQGLALAGVLLLGFGFRRRQPRWLMLTLLAVGTLSGLAAIGACGGGNSAVTPGTYSYTIEARDLNTATPVSALIDVTVP